MLHSVTMPLGARVYESYYRVVEYRGFIPRVGAYGRGVVQFLGQRVTRSYVTTPPKVWDWPREGQLEVYTLEPNADLEVCNMDRWIALFGDPDDEE